MKYSLINYFDVWGNDKDGYEVNNLCVDKTGITIAYDATEKEILDYLVQIGFLNTSDMRKVRINTLDEEMMEIYAVKGMQPLGRLEREV